MAPHVVCMPYVRFPAFHAGVSRVFPRLKCPNTQPGSAAQHIRDIIDPEHPYSLEELRVVSEDLITVDDGASRVR